MAKLRSRGVEFEDYETPPHATKHDGITNFGAVRAAWLKDSEGNLISDLLLAPFVLRSRWLRRAR